MKEKILEEVPVTTTSNAGQPLGNDRPIETKGIFRRFQKMKSEKEKTVNKEITNGV